MPNFFTHVNLEMYLTLCINAENRDEGVENHSEGTQQKTRPHSTEVRPITIFKSNPNTGKKLPRPFDM